ncbi:uncharacterized protein LTHEOB_13009 [Lasiodiplodia theobromae]|uniref:uncharacterized protein n=1 Tax=Lasiodiplodia theobromae TaxID=45133 RepID=UPI0015C3EF2F|nr:uncharacterized protein LTHEOB_13009 [Lasiodiplodia theobromae]KAF4534185.1 hypothetical protein LTHEOB_13009 [Lasiodiplodia theobromae]
MERSDITTYGPDHAEDSAVDATKWMLWSEDEFLSNCGLSPSDPEDQETYEEMKQIARTGIVLLGVGRGHTFQECIEKYPQDVYKQQRLICRYHKEKAKEVFGRTWTNLEVPEEEWYNWGWRATVMFVLKHEGSWDKRKFATAFLEPY